MKILLVNPPAEHVMKTELPDFMRSAGGVFPPLGLLYVAAYARKRFPGDEIQLLDCVVERQTASQAAMEIVRAKPDFVGITVHTHNLVDVANLISRVKAHMPEAAIILGGPHAHIFPEASARLRGVDVVVTQDGEGAFSEAVACLANKGDLGRVRGIAFRKDNDVVVTPPVCLDNRLDDLPFPDRSLLSDRAYAYPVGRSRRRWTSMIASRGCPHHCIFCSTPHGPFRLRSPRNIVDEMEECRRQGFEEIHFVDDTFNSFPDRVGALCDELQDRKLLLKWGARVRADNLNPALIKKMKSVGCSRLNIGVETSSEQGLAYLKKGTTIPQIRNVFQWIRQEGILTVAYFLIGCPFEKTVEDIEKTVEFAIDLNPDFALFNILALYPGTELHQKGVLRGLVAKDAWEKFANEPKEGFSLPFWNEWFSDKELDVFLNKAYRRFYLRPKFMLSFIRNLHGFRELTQALNIGISMLRKTPQN